MSAGPATVACPRCEASAPADARFCMSCGQALAPEEVADRERRARLAAAAPAPLVEKIRKTRLSGERKPVTALFADIVGSTALAERMDPEDWTALINGLFEEMSAAVFRYEGTIAQLQGDAMLAFFGAPMAHEDDPERAVRAALDMLRSTDDFARQLEADQGIQIQIRAGINTGPVVVGKVGSDLHYDYTAIGDAMNVAARLQAAAEPGTILISGHTHRLLGGAFEVEDLGDLEVRGKSEPVHAYRVLGAPTQPGRRRGLASLGVESPMVGRDDELASLLGLVDLARAGRGRVALLMGEPGIGKSRLMAELRGRVAQLGTGEGPVGWVEGRCLSYGRNLPYHLLRDLLRSALDLPEPTPGSGPSRDAFDRRLTAVLEDAAADVGPFLAHLLDLPLRPDEADRTRLGPDAIQGRYAASVHRVLRGLSSREPLILVCEDLHWADPASVAVIRMILPLAVQLPVVFVGAMRPETDTLGWELVTYARGAFGEVLTEIRLEPLSEADSRRLVAGLLAIESLPDRVRDGILDRAEGNPFFVEEVIRMLIERGVIEQREGRWVATTGIESVEIPDTLHGLLLARIDSLPELARQSLRVAAVIGRRFPVRVLERVLGETGMSPEEAAKFGQDMLAGQGSGEPA